MFINRVISIIIISAVILFSPKPILAVETISGTFHIFYGTSIDNGSIHSTIFVLSDDHGRIFQLDMDRYVNSYNLILSLDKKHVTLQGWFKEDGIFYVYSIEESMMSSQISNYEYSLIGEQSWVTILARFADIPYTPAPPTFFNDLLYSNLTSSLNSYWKETSYGNISIVGNTYGWYNLTNPKSYYSIEGSCGEEPRFDLLLHDMAYLADPDVNFNDYMGINLVYNDLIGSCIWGGSAQLTIDGETRIYSVTWLAPPALMNSYFAHEMGHGFGLHHSSGPYDTPYDSDWDIMSNTSNCRNYDPTFGCIAVNTISYHKAKLGWIPQSRIYIANNSTVTIDLYPLHSMTEDGYMMVKIPLGVDSFYTIEYRRQLSYDAGIPGSAVIIHKVDESLPDRQAQVVDPDNNHDPNDSASMWHVGEVFIDEINNIKISIIEDLGTHYKVNISRLELDLSNFTDSFIKNGELDVTFILGDSNRHGPYGWGAMVNDLVGSIGLATKLGQLSSSGYSVSLLDTTVAVYSNNGISIDWNALQNNIIVVGGPAVNLITYYYDVNRIIPFNLVWHNGIPYIHSSLTNREYTFTNSEDYAVISLIRDNNKDILIVWGLTHKGTSAALQLLQFYDSIYTNILEGNAMIIKWSDTNGNNRVDIDDTMIGVESW